VALMQAKYFDKLINRKMPLFCTLFMFVVGSVMSSYTIVKASDIWTNANLQLFYNSEIIG